MLAKRVRLWATMLFAVGLAGIVGGCDDSASSSSVEAVFPDTPPGPAPTALGPQATPLGRVVTLGTYQAVVELPLRSFDGVRLATAWADSPVGSDGRGSVRMSTEGVTLVVAYQGEDQLLGLAIVPTSARVAGTEVRISSSSTAVGLTYLLSGSTNSHPEATAIILATLADRREVEILSAALEFVRSEVGYLPFERRVEDWPGLNLRLSLSGAVASLN